MRKILVVDDVAGNRDLFMTVLEGDYTILEAADGKEALEVVRRELPDLVFLDVSMPGLSGIEVVRMMRKDSKLYGIPVIAITAHSIISARKAVENGCNDYLLKPLNENKITDMIQRWIG